ncbi:MAG: hypothetical protein ISR65_06240 [Bacteriovoracaceae bacterium]|nr:hypothetical protein [Bacteriovoracaceae bacterium]
MNTLITTGGTEELIDGVRYLSNFSTGKTGSVIADYFSNQGDQVTLVHGKRAVKPTNSDIKTVSFRNFVDLYSSLQSLLGEGVYHTVIHLAAVSDYSVDCLVVDGKKVQPDSTLKIDSTASLSINLKHNFKIIDNIKSYSQDPITLIGFKLTNTQSSDIIEQAVNKVLNKNVVDYLVHNNLADINIDQHKARIYNKNNLLKTTHTKLELAKTLFSLTRGAPSNDSMS